MMIKNRGAISNPEGRFEKETHEEFDDGWNFFDEEQELPSLETTLLEERAKSIITRNDSPDIGFDQSINPYRGCEHGCIYCMAAPMIPMINDMEMEKILKLGREAGALYASYTFIRLPFEVKDLFKEWLSKHFPDRAAHVMSIIRQMRGGKEYDATFGKRMVGEGEFANLLATRFHIACKRFNLNAVPPTHFDLAAFKVPGTVEQLQLL